MESKLNTSSLFKCNRETNETQPKESDWKHYLLKQHLEMRPKINLFLAVIVAFSLKFKHRLNLMTVRMSTAYVCLFWANKWQSGSLSILLLSTLTILKFQRHLKHKML